MFRDHSAAVLAAPPWPHVRADAVSSDRVWIPWARKWMWALLCAVLASEVEPSKREIHKSEGVATSSGNYGTSEPPPARGNRPKMPVLRLDLGEVIIDPPPRLPPSGAGTFWIKKGSSGSSAPKTGFAKRSADNERPRNPPSHDCLAADASASRHEDAASPSPAKDIDLSDIQSCAGSGGSPSVPIGAAPGAGRSGQWGAWVTKHRGTQDGDGDGRTHIGPVLMEPPALNLGDSQLCIPTSAEVVIWNEGERSCAGQGCSGDASTANANAGAEWTGEEFRRQEDSGRRDETVHLLSVTSNNPQFHPTSFRPQALPPDGHTSFQVVFLPRAIGDADAVLTVATSAGDVSYRVQAQGVQNPYKIQPVVESRISMGSPFTHPIVVFNPGDAPTLSITEIYTTEGFLHLTIPNDSSGSGAHGTAEDAPTPGRSSRKCSRCSESDSTAFRDPGGGSGMTTPSKPLGLFVEKSNHPRPTWRIPPGAELEVIRLSFHAEVPGNFQGYVHIRTDRESLVVPVELHVSTGGVDPTPSEVDFGVLTSPAERRQASISLFNSGTEPMSIVGARMSHPDPRINVGFRDGTIIPAGVRMDDAVRLVYSGGEPTLGKGGRQTDTSPSVGKVVIAVNHTLPELSVVEIDYRAHVLHGGVAYDWNQVSFQVGVDSPFFRQARGLPKADPSSGMGTTVNVSSDGGEEQSWCSFNKPGPRSSGGGKGERERPSLPTVETRALDLKNHFPTAIQLLSLTVEKCEDILSVSFVDPNGERSVALPQASWSGISLSFHWSVLEASGGDYLIPGNDGFRAYDGHGESHPVTPSPSLALQAPDLNAVERDHSFPAFEPLSRTSASGTRSGGGVREDDHPTTIADGGRGDESGVSGKGAFEAVPSVSADQRTPAQRAHDEHWHAHGAGSRGIGVDVEASSMNAFPLLWRPSSAPFACVLRAETNASTHHIPVFVFDGSLHFSLLGAEEDEEQEGFSEDLEGKAKARIGGRWYNSRVEKSRRATPIDWSVGSSSRFSLAASAGLPPDSRSRRVSTYTGAATSHSGRWGTTQSAGSGGAERGTKMDSSPTLTPPLAVHLGIVRAGTTARRRFNVTNLNPVEVNITTNELGGGEEGVLFASLRLLGTRPLPSAPQALLEIGRHMQGNQEPGATSYKDRSNPNAAAATSSRTPVPPAGGGDPDAGRQGRRQGQAPRPPLARELVRERVVEGQVVEREVSRGPSVGGDEGVFCALAPGSVATFEVEATAPEPGEMAEADRAVRMEVRGLLLSTPAETVPVLVTYDAVRGGMFFHASPLKTMGDESGGREPRVAVHLDRAFPGRSAVSGVSLRSTASWESRVEGMESSGPRVRATLTRRDVPGVSTADGGRDIVGVDESESIVEVGVVDYNASSRDCAGLDAWNCLARHAEEVVARVSGDLEGGDLEAGPAKGSEKGVLARTFLGMVGRLHDDTSMTLAHGTTSTPGEMWAAPAVRTGDCIGGASTSADPRRPGCERPQLSNDGGDWSDGDHAGVGARPVRQDTARASIELWRMLPALKAAGINRFHEEVTVRTTLGRSETPLSVIVSMTVPSLVVGAAANSSAVKRPGFTGSGDVDRYAPVRFPTTKVGNMREMFIEIRNPAEVPICVRLAAAEDGSSSWTEASPWEGGVHAEPSASAAVSHHASGSEAMLSAFAGLSPIVTVAPGASAAMGPVRFMPLKEGVFSAHVYLVNNLTQVEPVLLEGEAGTSRLVIRPLVRTTPGVFQASASVAPAPADAGPISGNSSDVASGGGEMGEEKRNGYGDDEHTVARFPVDFLSWARSFPTTEPVVKRWVVFNQGTMPLVLDGLGIRMEERGRTWLGIGAWGGDTGGRSAGDNSAIRLLRWVVSGMARENTASPRGWSGAAVVASTAAIAGGAATVLCSDGGFRVNFIGGEACEGWRPQTLRPGEEMEVVVGYSAAHCDPVNRTLEVLSSSGIVSIQMMASACGGPSAVAACRSARRAAAAAAVKAKDSKAEAETGIEGPGSFWGGWRRGWGGRGRGRWSRALFVIEMALLMGGLYGALTVLWIGRDLPPLAGWVRRLQARVAGCVAASSRACGGFAVSVEVHASAAVVVSSPPPPLVPLASGAAASRAPFEGSAAAATSSQEKPLTPAQRLPGTAGSPTLEAFDTDAYPCPSNPSSHGVHQQAGSLVMEVGHEDVSEEERGSDRNAGARRSVATDDADGAPSGGAVLVTPETKPLVVVPEALHAGRFDAGEVDNESPVNAALGDRDADYIVSSPSPSTAATATVEILTSPGQASRPNRQQRPARAPPVSEKADDRRHGEKRVMSPPLSSGVVRQQSHATGFATASKIVEVARSPSHPAHHTLDTSKPATGGQSAKFGSDGSTASTAMHDGNGGPSPHEDSPLHDQKANEGRFSPPGAGGGGGRAAGTPPHKRGSGNSNSKARGQGYHQQRPTHAIRGGSRQHRGHGPVRPPPGGRSLPYGRLSLSASGSCSAAAAAGAAAGAVTDSPNPPALASPAASISTEAMDHRNSQQFQQQQQKGGAFGEVSHGASPPPSGTNGSFCFSRRDQHHRREGEGEGAQGSGGASTTRSSLTRHHASGTASSDWGPAPPGPYPRQAPFPVPTGHHKLRSEDDGTPSRTDSFAAGRLLQAPSSDQWGADRVSSWSPPCAPSASGHVSPPLAPIGSNRLRAKPYGAGPVGASRRAPPGLTPPPPNQVSSYLPRASAEPTLTPASSGFSTTEEADWSDNLDAFATASAVVAGVLSAEDMSDGPTPVSPLSCFGRMPGGPELAVFGQDPFSVRPAGNGSRLRFYMSATPSASSSGGGGPGGNAGSEEDSLTAASFGSTEKQLLFGTSEDGVRGAGMLSFMYEGDEG